MAELPKLKKKITAFFSGEEGKISKDKIIKAGLFIGSAAISSALLSKSINAEDCSHTNNNVKVTPVGKGAVASHGHHCSHSSHNAGGGGGM